MRNKRIEYIIDEILDQYAYADESTRPWIIGFSGGKDSTVLLILSSTYKCNFLGADNKQ